jgi:replicative DNA helicase
MNALAKIDDADLGNVAIEQELLGTILITNSAFDIIERLVSAGDFYEPLNGRLFEAFASVHDAHGFITPSLVIASMGGDASMIVGDGMTLGKYIARAAAIATIPRNLPAYAKQIREFAYRRKILATAETMMLCVQANQPAADIAGGAIEAIDDIATASTAGATPQVSIREADDEAMARMQYGMQNPGRLAGISWGLKSLDIKTSGLERGKMYVPAGRPGMGKSALAVSIANAAAAADVPTLFFSLEMNAADIANRGLADMVYDGRQPLPYTRIASGDVTEAQFKLIDDAARKRREWPLQIDPMAGLTVSQIASRARKHKQILERQGKTLGLLIIDHMHIMAMSGRYSGSRVNEVSEASAALKRLAKDLDVPVVALAQLNRALENRESKRPTMADLRDSGSIEQDADTIIFVHREAYYLERPTGGTLEQEMIREDKLAAARYDLEAIVAKQRSGPTGTVNLFCDIACNAVRDLGGVQ